MSLSSVKPLLNSTNYETDDAARRGERWECELNEDMGFFENTSADAVFKQGANRHMDDSLFRSQASTEKLQWSSVILRLVLPAVLFWDLCISTTSSTTQKERKRNSNVGVKRL